MVLARRHRKILDPLRRGDADEAGAAMREHLLEAARWLEEASWPVRKLVDLSMPVPGTW